MFFLSLSAPIKSVRKPCGWRISNQAQETEGRVEGKQTKKKLITMAKGQTPLSKAC